MAKKEPAAPTSARARERDEPRTFELDDVAPSDAFRIKGETYAARRPSSLSLIEQATLSRTYKRMKKIGDKVEKGHEPSAAESREYRKLAETVASLAIADVPPAVLAELSDESLGQVALVFFTRATTAGPYARTIRALVAGAASSSAR